MSLKSKASKAAKSVLAYKGAKSGLKGMAALFAGRWLYKKWQARKTQRQYV